MTAAFTERDWQRIVAAANREFVWTPMQSLKQSRRVTFGLRRAAQLQKACDNFRGVMESEHPPRTKDEAIRQIVGAIGRLLSIIFPQYALLIAMISFLWDVSTGNAAWRAEVRRVGRDLKDMKQ